MSNKVIFGKDAFRVDIIAHWLAGHEPGNFGLFHIGMERGLSDVLDPFDIPIYLWEDGKATKVKLDSFERTLNIRTGGTTSDKKFSLEAVACVGACSIAPVVKIGENVIGNVQAKDVEKILKDLDNKNGKRGGDNA